MLTSNNRHNFLPGIVQHWHLCSLPIDALVNQNCTELGQLPTSCLTMLHNLCSDTVLVVSPAGALVGQSGCRNAIECRSASSSSSSAPGILVTIHSPSVPLLFWLLAFCSHSSLSLRDSLPHSSSPDPFLSLPGCKKQSSPNQPILALASLLFSFQLSGFSLPYFQPRIESPAQLLAVSLIFFHSFIPFPALIQCE